LLFRRLDPGASLRNCASQIVKYDPSLHAEERRKVVHDSLSLQGFVKDLNRRYQILKNVKTSLSVSGIELVSRPIREPIEASFSGSDPRPVVLGAELPAVFVGVEPIFKLDNADAHILVQQELDGAFGGACSGGVGIEIQVKVRGIAAQHADLFDG